MMDSISFNSIVSFIWGIADDCLRDVYVRGKYRDVILPMTVIRRLDAVLEETKPAVLEMKKKLDEAGITNQTASLCQIAGEPFCNSSPFCLKDLKSKAKAQQLKTDFEAYLNGFSPNVQEILDKFKFRNQIATMIDADILGSVIEKFVSPTINLSPRPVLYDDGSVKLPGLDNHTMGLIFEELIRRFNEENNEEAGEHFTPRDAVELMADLIIMPIAGQLKDGTYTCYDGACGTGGMLTIAVQDKTIELANRLLANGIDIILDVYDLKDGQDKYAFMEQSVNDPTVNHVLIICDKTYAEKANARAGGVGDETVIITPEIYGNAKQTKFIPVIFEKDENGNAYRPTYIKSRIYVDLSDENSYEAEYEKLLRDLYHKPLFQKPALGRKPEWLENETVDFSAIRDGIKQLKGLSDTKSTKAECLIRRTADNFTEVIKQYKCTGAKDLNVEFLKLIDKSKNYRNLVIEYFQVLLEGGYSCSEIFVEFFEKLYNDTHDATEDTKYSTQDAEFFDFLIWEIFISTTALLLHFEKYQDLYSILSHKYYLRISPLNHKFDFYDYGYFRTASQIIENIRNQTEPRPITLAGKIIVEREEKPILTKDAICNADIVLYQLGKILRGNNNYGFIKWFPITYIYYDKTQTIWHKLRSQKHCLKITSLFGVKTIQELKTILQQAQSQNPLGYPSAWDYAPEILSSIQIEEIGTLP